MLRFRRIVSPALLAAVAPGGAFSFLVDEATAREGGDVQLRCTTDGKTSSATLYLGLTAALTLHETGGAFRLDAHRTHRTAAQFDQRWSTPRSIGDLAADVGAIRGYVDRLWAPGMVDPRWFAREGIVQANLSRPGQPWFGVVQREAEVWSDPGHLADDATGAVSDRLWAAIAGTGRSDRWWPGVRDRGERPTMGRAVDLLGRDVTGRVAVIEVKPAAETVKIPWAAAQVTVYAELFARWLIEDPGAAADLEGMAEQRMHLGLLEERWAKPVRGTAVVVPAIAIGGGSLSKEALPRLAAIAEVLHGTTPRDLANRVDPLEVWLCSANGKAQQIWRPSEEPSPRI